MSLKDTIQSAAGTAFAVVKSLQTSVTIKHITGQVFNPATLVNTPTYSDTVLIAIVANFSKREIDNSTVLSSDLKVAIEGVLIAIITPADKVDIAGTVYDIVSVDTDPADAAWILQVRR